MAQQEAVHESPPTIVRPKETTRSYSTESWSSLDGKISHYTLVRPTNASASEQAVLFLSITRDSNSFGRNPTEEPRSFRNHLEFITATTLSETQVSIAILTSSEDEFESYIKLLTPPDTSDGGHPKSAETRDDPNSKYFGYDFARVTVVLHTADTRQTDPETSKTDTSRDNRHGIPQHERRAHLAKLRNYLQNVALHHETHLLWLDADVYKFSSKNMVEAMMQKTTLAPDRDVGVLTARCAVGEQRLANAWLEEHPEFSIPDGPGPDDNAEQKSLKEEMRGKQGGRYEIIAHKLSAVGTYDLNAWRGGRNAPNDVQQQKLWVDKASWEPSPAAGVKMVDAAIDGTSDDDLVRLDAVGGTVLMIRADLVRMGLMFTPGYFVGMTWEHGEGYDGIETEGLCVVTRSFSRDGQSTCYTMGGDWAVYHTIW